MAEKHDLLNLLYESLRICYLSDLHLSTFYPQIAEVLEPISPEQYDIGSWTDACNYILSEMNSFTSEEAAKKHLLSEVTKFIEK